MPERDWRLRLQDIFEALSAVEAYIAGHTFSSFEAHAYFRVDIGIVWKTASVFGPQLLANIRRQIEEEDLGNGTDA